MTPGTPSKRYLCQAPRPDAWDDRAEDVLRNLAGSPDQHVACIREALVRAKRRNPYTPKAGPGRKTNAEHAFAFYEHLLDKLDAKLPHDEIDAVRKKDESEDEEEEDAEEESVRSSESTAYIKKGGAAGNHSCEVCDEPGELIMCSECNLHFHTSCVRPVMTTSPEAATWRCSYCVLSTEPKSSKQRRQAAAAVRMMARLRNRCRRVKETEKSKGGESRPEEEEISHGNECLEEQELLKKPILDDGRQIRNKVQLDEPQRSSSNRDVGEKTPSSMSVDTDESHGRAKRARKQPTLYDPQLCPASKWESDDVRAKKAVGAQSDTSDDDTATPVHRDQEQNDEDAWCNFCGDDPMIKVCCFCACRVCFGKHHQTKLLLCDRCDDEYHTFCLDPPLKAVPKKKWFCPSCAHSEEKRVDRTSSRVETRGKWKAQSSDEHNGSPAHYKEIVQDQPRDISGRFLSPGIGRRRSKSPKTSTPEETRKRGRPPSSNKLLGSQRKAMKDGSSKGRGSGPHIDSGNATPSESVSFTVSRSGRTVKRNSFHDEVGPGEQHLRGRPAAEPITSQLYATLLQNSAGQVPTEDFVPIHAASSSDAPRDAARNVQTPFTPVARVSSRGEEPDLKDSVETSLLSGAKVDLSAEPKDPHLPSGLSVDASNPAEQTSTAMTAEGKVPRRKPGARECMQISRRFGAEVIPQKYIDILLDYCKRGKVEHLIRMRERLDDHARFLESQLAGLEARLAQKEPDTGAASTAINHEPAVPVVAEPENPMNPGHPRASKHVFLEYH